MWHNSTVTLKEHYCNFFDLSLMPRNELLSGNRNSLEDITVATCVKQILRMLIVSSFIFRRQKKYVLSEKKTFQVLLSFSRQESFPSVTGKSIFFDVENFDVVKGILPEPMHLMDGGFMKNTAGRTFRSGTAQQTRAGYRRTSSATLSTLIE